MVVAQPNIQKLADTVSYLQQDMAKVGTLVDRLDTTIDKLADISNNVSILLAVHENKISIHDNITKQILELIEKRRGDTDDKIQTIHARISSGEKEMSEKIDVQYDDIISELKDMRKESTDQHNKLSNRITTMEKWMWAVVGGSGVLGGLIAIAIRFIPA